MSLKMEIFTYDIANGGIDMENKTNSIQNINKKKETMMFCGVITCINCVNETCTADSCDLYEDSQLQEG